MQQHNLQPGLSADVELVVKVEDTARHLGSGNIHVLATPRMISLMEQASVKAVDPLLPEGQQTVGASISVRHLAATPVGMKVSAHSELVEVDGRRLVFNVFAEDERERVGEGTHERWIIDAARFLSRVEKKQEG